MSVLCTYEYKISASHELSADMRLQGVATVPDN